MQNLIRFLVKNSPLLTWLLLAVLCIVVMCQRSAYHRSVIFSSANSAAGAIESVTGGVVGYFGLRTANEELLARIGELSSENLALRRRLQELDDSIFVASDKARQYDYMVAHVVGNSIRQAENYITLDKGSADGVCVDYGVADQNGIVGIVDAVSEHYSLVISVLHVKFFLNVMLRGSESCGTLAWDGRDHRYAVIEQLPRSTAFSIGDTVVTSGLSASFPKDVPVGLVVDSYDQPDDNNFIVLRVELFTDFNRLGAVHVIRNAFLDERRNIDK